MTDDDERATLRRARSLRAEAGYQIAVADKALRGSRCVDCGGTPPNCCRAAGRAYTTGAAE